jgi:hypothetical protein
MNDTITTARAKAVLTFEDNTTVKITEQSKLIIDDFVYDPKQGTGKLAVKVALGTARYASGQIAKNNPQNVNVQTPTATIAVRGTDFSMTVDELGRGLVMLLPSCDAKSCVTGAISVSNEAGTVYLDVPYQATLITSLSTPPSAPVVVSMDQNNINNMLIITAPPEVKSIAATSKNALDANMLDVDLLKYGKLDENALDKFKDLDINFLDVDLFGDALVTFTVNALDMQRPQLVNLLDKELLPNYNESTGLKYCFNDDKTSVTLHRTTSHTAYVTLPIDQDSILNLVQDGVQVLQQVNRGGTSVINIVQK